MKIQKCLEKISNWTLEKLSVCFWQVPWEIWSLEKRCSRVESIGNFLNLSQDSQISEAPFWGSDFITNARELLFEKQCTHPVKTSFGALMEVLCIFTKFLYQRCKYIILYQLAYELRSYSDAKTMFDLNRAISVYLRSFQGYEVVYDFRYGVAL